MNDYNIDISFRICVVMLFQRVLLPQQKSGDRGKNAHPLKISPKLYTEM